MVFRDEIRISLNFQKLSFLTMFLKDSYSQFRRDFVREFLAEWVRMHAYWAFSADPRKLRIGL